MEPPCPGAQPGLGVGESAAIRLARKLDCPLLLDERRARVAARKQGLRVLGTGRVLLAAKERGLIPGVGRQPAEDTGHLSVESQHRVAVLDQLAAAPPVLG